jgi:GxxExxY protein
MRNEETVGKAILDAAFKVHTALGPGLLESVYEVALARALEKRGFRVQRQQPIPVYYEDEKLEVGFRADLIVESLVLVELKSVETVTPVFRKIATNYLRLIPLRLGYLINFNELHLKDGILRIVNKLEGKPSFPPRRVSREVGEGGETRPSSSRPSLPSQTSRELPGPSRVSREGGEGSEVGEGGETLPPSSRPSLPSQTSRELPGPSRVSREGGEGSEVGEGGETLPPSSRPSLPSQTSRDFPAVI